MPTRNPLGDLALDGVGIEVNFRVSNRTLPPDRINVMPIAKQRPIGRAGDVRRSHRGDGEDISNRVGRVVGGGRIHGRSQNLISHQDEVEARQQRPGLRPERTAPLILKLRKRDRGVLKGRQRKRG